MRGGELDGGRGLEPVGRKGADRAVFRSNDLIRRDMAQSSGEASLPGWREGAGGQGEDSLAERLLCAGLRPGPEEPVELGLLVQGPGVTASRSAGGERSRLLSTARARGSD